MEVLSVKNIGFTYENAKEPVLDNINFTIEKGMMLLVAGKSGCGKTTLLKLIKQCIAPKGNVTGEIKSYYEDCKIGYIFQDPEAQIVCSTVREELVFGAENIGMPIDRIRLSLGEISSYLGIEDLLDKKTATLSGGQKQMINLASVLMMKPEMLLLDEPLSQLDPVSTYDFCCLLDKLKKELGITIIIAEHNMDKVIEMTDAILYMPKGKYYSNKQDFVRELIAGADEFKKSLPMTVKLFDKWSENDKPQYPLSFSELVRALQDSGIDELDKIKEKLSKENEKTSKIHSKNSSKTSVTLSNISFRYDRKEKDVIKDLSLTLEEGKVYGLIGGNGCGKSTLFSIIDGYRKPYKGKTVINGKAAYLPQNPKYCFIEDTILKDYLMIADRKDIDSLCEKYKFLADIPRYFNTNPMDLSGGQLQSAAIGKMLLCDLDVLLLDEPTKAFDGALKESLKDVINSLKENNKTVVVISHDLEFVQDTADICMFMFDGAILSMDTPDKIFADNRFYTTVKGKLSNVTF